jgi:hypothetical protein
LKNPKSNSTVHRSDTHHEHGERGRQSAHTAAQSEHRERRQQRCLAPHYVSHLRKPTHFIQSEVTDGVHQPMREARKMVLNTRGGNAEE